MIVAAEHPLTGAVASFETRDEVASDPIVVRECWQENVYRVCGRIDGHLVIDLGANIGAFSVLAATLGARMVVAVEPDLDNLAMLQRNIGRNPAASSVVVVPFAATRDGEDVHMTGVGGGRHVVPVTQYDTNPGDRVAGIRLAELIGDNDVDLLKIDVEGSEYDVFETLPDASLDRIGRIVMEFHKPRDVDRFGRLVARLTQWGHVETLGSWTRGGMIFANRYQ